MLVTILGLFMKSVSSSGLVKEKVGIRSNLLSNIPTPLIVKCILALPGLVRAQAHKHHYLPPA